MRSMHVVSRSGKVSAGFDAVVRVASRLPLFRPLALVGGLPGVASLGRIVYDRIASSRPRDAACTDDACGIHPPASSSSSAQAPLSPGRDSPPTGGHVRDLSQKR